MVRKFNPPISGRDTDDLIFIYFCERGEWHKDAVALAKIELEKRGLSEEKAKERLKNIKDRMAHFWTLELEKRKTESYSVLNLILMTLFFYREIFRDWDLKKEGYLKKHKQRLYTLALGLMFYIFIFVWAVQGGNKMEQDWISEIETIAIQDSIIESTIDWSSTLQFEENKFDETSHVKWELEINKKLNEHFALLTISKNKNQLLKMECLGVLTENGLKFIHDSVIINHTAIQIGLYDKLFEIIIDDNDTLVYWNKLEPIGMNKFHNGYKYFERHKE